MSEFGATSTYRWHNAGGDHYRWRTYETRFPVNQVTPKILSLNGVEAITKVKPYECTIWVASLFSWDEMQPKIHAILDTAAALTSTEPVEPTTTRSIYHVG